MNGRFPDLILFRHGQTEWNREGLHQGRLDSPLTAMGRQQAAALTGLIAPLLAKADWRAFTSPTGRAARTAEIALTPLGMTATPDDRLQEVHFGEWQGHTSADIDALWPGIVEPDPFLWNFRAPGGEELATVTARAESFLADLGGPAILSTHGLMSRVLRGVWLGLDAEGMRGLDGGQGCLFLLRDGQHRRIG